MITPAEAVAFVQGLQPVGILSAETFPHKDGQAVTVKVLYRPGFAPARQDGHAPGHIDKSLDIRVRRRADGTLWGQCWWVGHPHISDWCRPCCDQWDDHICDCPVYTCDIPDGDDDVCGGE